MRVAAVMCFAAGLASALVAADQLSRDKAVSVLAVCVTVVGWAAAWTVGRLERE